MFNPSNGKLTDKYVFERSSTPKFMPICLFNAKRGNCSFNVAFRFQFPLIRSSDRFPFKVVDRRLQVNMVTQQYNVSRLLS